MLPGNFPQTLIYEVKATPEEVLRDLATLWMQSERAARRRRFWGWTAVVWLFVSVLCFIALVGHTPPSIVIAIAIIGALGFIADVILAYQLGRGQLRSRRSLSAITAIRCLACDVAHKAPIAVRIDFNDCVRPATLLTETRIGPVRSGSYRSTWLRLSGQFVDRTKFDFQADVRCKQKRRSRRKGDRIKRDLWEHLCLTLKVQELKPGAGRNWSDRVRELKPPSGLSLRGAEGIEGQLYLEFATEHVQQQFLVGNLGSGGVDESKLSSHRALLFPFLAAYDALSRMRSA